MRQIASTGQLRGALLRWALWLVPLTLLLGFLAGQAAGSGPSNAWFDALAKPAIYPPRIAFPIVWSALYVLMGLAAAMVGAARGARGRSAALIAFAVQLALNLAWTPVFFAAHEMRIALGVIAALDVAVVLTIWLFRRVRPLAALLLVPYLAWILFATALNWQFIAANPDGGTNAENGAVSRVAI